MIRVPAVAENYLLDELLSAVDTYYHLYVADIDLSAATVLADFTEPTWSGYSPRRSHSWTPAVQVAGRAVSYGDPILWVRGSGGSGNSVYGYYVTDKSTGALLWCERRVGGPISMIGSTDQLEVFPRVTLREDPEEGPSPPPTIQGQGDLVGGGSSTVGPLPPPTIQGQGDLVGDGSALVLDQPTAGGGDLVGDGSALVLDQPTAGGGDLVGDGSTLVLDQPTAGGGDLVGDGSTVEAGGIVFLVGDAAGSTNGSTVTTGGIDTTGCDLLVVSVSAYTTDGVLTDSNANVWTPLTAQTASGDANQRNRLYYAANPTVGAGHTFTLTGVTNFPAIAVAGFSGVAGSPFDQETGSGTAAPGSLTPSVSGCVVVTGLGQYTATSVSVDAGFTVAGQVGYLAGNHLGVGLAYLIQTGIAAADPTWSATVGSFGAVASTAASFKPG